MPVQAEAPPLATYKSIGDYRPAYADVVIRKRWWRTWYGVVVDYDEQSNVLAVAFESTPQLLVTMYPEEIKSSIFYVKLDDVKRMRRGRWYILQSVGTNNVWYV